MERDLKFRNLYVGALVREKGTDSEFPVRALDCKKGTVTAGFTGQEFKISQLEGIPVDGRYLQGLMFDNGDEFSDQALHVDFDEQRQVIVIKDGQYGNLVTTCRYVHEFENVMYLLTGYEVVSAGDYDPTPWLIISPPLHKI